MFTDDQLSQIRQIIGDEFNKNYSSGVPRVPPHIHNGVDNLQINGNDIVNLPTSPPGGVDGDIQINASGAFGTIKGLHLSQTGNTRGTDALDIQTKRAVVTQVASGLDSIAIGRNNTASGDYSLAIGNSNTASGYESSSSGYANTSSGHYATASGYLNVASAKASSAMGDANTASGQYSVAMGSNNKAQGTNDVSVGHANTTSNYGSSIAIGISNTVSNGGWAFGVNANSATFGRLIIKTLDNSLFNLGPDNNFGIKGLSYGGGKVVVFLANATTVPTSNPTGGGILYSTAGALHWLGSAGTDTPIAPA